MRKIKLIRSIFAVAIITIIILSWPVQSNSQLRPGWEEVHPLDIPDMDMDVDLDGMFDQQEKRIGTNPRRADTDFDGFNDLFEYNFRAFGFDPLRKTRDRDRDGLSDAFEREWGTSPTNPDTDGDSLSDFDEIMNRRFGYDPVQRTQDSDFDGLADRLERTIGSSLDNPDSNGDGVNDFQAFQADLSPNMRVDATNHGEMVGKAYSEGMEKALLAMRRYGGRFPPELARELPYPAVTRRLYGRKGRDLAEAGTEEEAEPGLSPSSALMQQSVGVNPVFIDPRDWPAFYPTYNQVLSRLKDVALAFDGYPYPNLVRLFRYSRYTEEHRGIYALKISDNPHLNEPATEHEILFMGLHHGKELITASFTLRLIGTLTQRYAGDQTIETLVNGSEIWVIPIVNPDGYAMAVSERGQGANVNWRKNVRKVAEVDPYGNQQTESTKGVDPCRNYGFEHIRTLSAAERAALFNAWDGGDALKNGLNTSGDFNPHSETYAGLNPFSDVEAMAVAGLANNHFYSGDEIGGLRCSLSWHTGGNGAVIHPMNHDTTNGLDGNDIGHLNCLAETFADASGYWNHEDEWWATVGYQSFGTSDDWLYKHNGILAVTVEAYSAKEGSGGRFFPEGSLSQTLVVNNNLKAAINFIMACWIPFCP